MVFAQWVVRLHGREKVARNQLRSLVDQLIEGVLSVGAGLAPDDGTRRIVHGQAVAPDALAVALHVALLKVGRKTMQILVVRKDGVRLRAEKVVIPDAEQTENDRQILLQLGSAKMLVHRMRAREQRLEILRADGKHDRQANRRPERVTSAHPDPELKHI